MMKYIFTAAFLFYYLFTYAQSERINFTAPQLYPEGVAYNPKSNLFYVSSVKTGTIGSVDAQGNYKEVYSNKDLKSSYGMKVDSKNNCLWVCVSDANYSKFADSATHKKMARVICINLENGSKIKDVNLSTLNNDKHFANDLTLDDKGNLYITDSYSNVIYKVDAQGKASIFSQSELFKGKDLGLNGIVWHPQGFLLAAHNTNGVLYKIEIANPSKITRVKISNFFPGADGLLLDEKNNLILVQNKGVDKAFRISTTDNWASAKVQGYTTAADMFVNPTTATFQKEKLYVLNSKMNELQDSTKAPSNEFSIQVANIKPAE